MSGWKSVSLGDVTELVTKGTTPPTTGEGFTELGINFIKSESVGYNGRIDKSAFVFISPEMHEKLKRSQLKKNDILFSMAGVFLGKNALVTEEMLPANTNQALAIIRLDQKKAIPIFVHYFLRQQSTIELVNNMSGQSAQPNINFQEIKSITMSLPEIPEQKAIAAELYKEIVALKPEWHSDDLNKGAIKVVMTAASSDGPLLAKHHTTKEQRKQLAERMKNDDDPLKLVIVRDMWLTGFDAPSMHTLYIDKPMKGHNLMQAIARVNRVHKDKPGGLVVDYLGIAADLKEALSFYSDAGGKGDPALAQEQAVSLMLEKLEVVSAMYHGFAYENYFEAETSQKLSLILAAEEHMRSTRRWRTTTARAN